MLNAMCGYSDTLQVDTHEYGRNRKGRMCETMEYIQKKDPFLSKNREAFAFMEMPEEVDGVSSSRVRGLLWSGDGSISTSLHPAVWRMVLEKRWLKMEIDRFRGEYDFLSNFYGAQVEYEVLIYSNNEAAFQAQKCMTRKKRAAFCKLFPGEASGPHQYRRLYRQAGGVFPDKKGGGNITVPIGMTAVNASAMGIFHWYRM